MLEFSDVEGLRAVVYCLLLFCSMTLAVEQCVADVGLVASEKKPEARLVLLAACGVGQNCRKFHFWVQFRPVWPSPLTKCRLFWRKICPSKQSGELTHCAAGIGLPDLPVMCKWYPVANSLKKLVVLPTASSQTSSPPRPTCRP